MAFPSLSTSLAFKVQRREPELITPAKPTPHEYKHLSDIDDQEGLRFHVPLIQFYRNNPSMREMDPVKIIREAIAKTLVFYYPFAGRLREGPNRKLMVECTGEGIYFTEADAEVTLDQFGHVLQPPFPCYEELLFDVPASGGVLNCPLLLIQVTRLKCGGFIFALRLNHTMTDGPGIAQFLGAMSEFARGSHSPSVLPLWERHLLNANEPPRVTHQHLEYEVSLTNNEDKDNVPLKEEMVDLSFFFGPKEISTLKSLVPHGRHTTFELLTACIWKCRCAALQLNPEDDVRFMCIVNARNKFNPPLPVGYYGNAFVYPAVVTTAGKLSQNPLDYALQLVKTAKAEFSEEYVRSVAALMVSKGRPPFTTTRSFIVSNISRVGLQDVDFGWGRPLYSGVAKAGAGDCPGVSYFGLSTNKRGEKGIVVPLRLPAKAVEKFVIELQNIMKNQPTKRDIAWKLVNSSL